MSSRESIIFKMLIAKRDTAIAYKKAIRSYLMGNSERTDEMFDDVTDHILYRDIYRCSRFVGDTDDTTEAINELIRKQKAKNIIVGDLPALVVCPM